MYPSGLAHVSLSNPSNTLHYNWIPLRMSNIRDYKKNEISTTTDGTEQSLIMFALPHHMDMLTDMNASIDSGLCLPTLHGDACLVIGQVWQVFVTLPKVGFYAKLPIRKELRQTISTSVKQDLLFQIPDKYMKGIGDTYFSGKMLMKLARILLVAEEIGVNLKSTLFTNALSHLRRGVEIWLNGSAMAKFVYDQAWGGLINCGCELNETQTECLMKLPDCSTTFNPSYDFGNGFYNDHHFHYGYHIYAAAVVTKFDPIWGRQFHQHVLLMIRDIANPSHDDPYFPTWRHKDWYLGSSWSSGIVITPEWNEPYPYGRFVSTTYCVFVYVVYGQYYYVVYVVYVY